MGSEMCIRDRYSLRNELRFFFSQGVPLCLSAILEWGAPPLITMFFAGSTPDSVHLQSALGYGRVYFNVSMLMVMLSVIYRACTSLQLPELLVDKNTQKS